MSYSNHPVNLLRLEGIPILEQLQIEEGLLRADDRNWCIVNHGSPPAIVMGISGKAHELIDLPRLQTSPVPVIRRFSGGGTVLIDEDTWFVTFIFNAASVPIEPFPEKIMRWTETLYKPFFAPHPFALQENDYVMGARKCGGNAQSICKGRWLHHSSFLWDYCQQRMNHLLLPKKAPGYRAQRSHDEFLFRLKDFYPGKQQMVEDWLDCLKNLFVIQEAAKADVDALVKSRPHRQSTKVEFENLTTS